jgi:hypothetical protein
MKPRQGDGTRLALRAMLVDAPLETQLRTCLNFMAMAADEGDVVFWLKFRHLLARTVLQSSAKAVA